MKLAFVFPGQGSQYVGMGQAIAQAYPAGRAALDEADAALGGGLLKLMYEGPEQEPGKVVEPANYNSPEQTVIAGHAPAVDRAIAICKAKGAKRALPLPVSAPFHCSLMSPVQPKLAEVLGGIHIRQPNAPVIANATADPNADPARIVSLLLTQVTAPVRWVETIQKMVMHGVDTVIELGPGKVLTGLARRIDKGLRAHAVEDPAGLTVVLREVFK